MNRVHYVPWVQLKTGPTSCGRKLDDFTPVTPHAEMVSCKRCLAAVADISSRKRLLEGENS